MVRRGYDGPCCSSIVKFGELIPVPNFQSLSVWGQRPSTTRRDNDGPSCDPSTQQLFSKVILLLETTKQVVTLVKQLVVEFSHTMMVIWI